MLPAIGSEVRIKPRADVPGVIVHLLPPPAQRPCPAEGATVTVTPWIVARLRQGDLVIVPAAAAAQEG